MRDAAAVDGACAGLESAAYTGSGNLLALAIDAARARATVGEISRAMENAPSLGTAYGHEHDQSFGGIARGLCGDTDGAKYRLEKKRLR